jgi:hypothetical protein
LQTAQTKEEENEHDNPDGANNPRSTRRPRPGRSLRIADAEFLAFCLFKSPRRKKDILSSHIRKGRRYQGSIVFGFPSRLNEDAELRVLKDTDMLRESTTRRPLHIARTSCLFVIIACTSSVARSQDTEQQLQLLKEQLETLEHKISTLEQQIEKQKDAEEQKSASDEQSSPAQHDKKASVVQIPETIQRSLSEQSSGIGAKFQGQLPSEPTYDMLREADEQIAKLQERESAFEFHGYFRSGFGLNSKGGQ